MIRTTALAAILAASLALPAHAAAPTEPAREVIDTTMTQLLEVLADKDLPAEERSRRIEAIAYSKFDFERMSRLVLGKSYKQLTPEQRDQFTEEFRRHLSLTYRRRIDSYTNEKIQTGDARLIGEKIVAVPTKLVGGTADGLVVEYRLHERDGAWQVIDILIEGVSLMVSFRSQVEEIIAANGPAQLIEKLREKNARAEAAAGGTTS
jgi:phospholipid transport system substrate-binding protein